jgi:hypothetical protein
MTKTSKDAILGAAAKTLAWELYANAGYGRTRAWINVERFDRELSSAVKQWRAAKHNLSKERRTRSGKNNA